MSLDHLFEVPAGCTIVVPKVGAKVAGESSQVDDSPNGVNRPRARRLLHIHKERITEDTLSERRSRDPKVVRQLPSRLWGRGLNRVFSGLYADGMQLTKL